VRGGETGARECLITPADLQPRGAAAQREQVGTAPSAFAVAGGAVKRVRAVQRWSRRQQVRHCRRRYDTCARHDFMRRAS